MIIAIDGPSGSGKSTTASGVAKTLGFTYLDTGAMYRALTYGLIIAKINLNDIKKVCKYLEGINITFDSLNRIILNGADVSSEIRKKVVTSKVSKVSAIQEVRKKMVYLQRKISNNIDCVIEGRDIGTVVFPDADYKFFLTADKLVRAKRRMLEFENIGEKIEFNEVLAGIEKRDKQDSSRIHSPLKKAKDAVTIDSSSLTIDKQIELIVDEVKNNNKQ